MCIPFKEVEVGKITIMPGMFGGPDYPEFDYPVSHKENYHANMRGQGYWVPTSNDIIWFCPSVYPDNAAKGNVHEAVKMPREKLGGPDMFGIEWTYQADIGGSTVRPGTPLLSNANEWKDLVKFPDINTWAWEESIRLNTDYLKDGGRLVNTVICTGWFERLISFMDFAQAALALIDKKQRQAVNELFETLSDFYIKVIDKYLASFPGLIHGITVHDDWGSQQGQMISDKTLREVFLPPIKRVVDHIHSKGLYADMHNCGRIDKVMPILSEIGFDRLEVMPLVDRDNFYRNYGDRMMLTYTPDAPPAEATDEYYEEVARDFVDKYFNKGRLVLLETYYQPMPMAFLKELYIYSRKKSGTF